MSDGMSDMYNKNKLKLGKAEVALSTDARLAIVEWRVKALEKSLNLIQERQEEIEDEMWGDSV